MTSYKRKTALLIAVVIVVAAAVIVGVRVYSKLNSPFAWKYKKEIAAAIEDRQLESIEFDRITGSGDGYTLHFALNDSKVSEAGLRDAVSALNAVSKLGEDSAFPLYQKDITIKAMEDNEPSEGMLTLLLCSDSGLLKVSITNSTVQDLSCLNNTECSALELTVVHDEMFDPERLFEIKSIAKLSVADCYDISRDAHKRITLDEELIARLKEKYPGIVIENS